MPLVNKIKVAGLDILHGNSSRLNSSSKFAEYIYIATKRHCIIILTISIKDCIAYKMLEKV
jgi:hypothetical protein